MVQKNGIVILLYIRLVPLDSNLKLNINELGGRLFDPFFMKQRFKKLI